MTYTFFETEIQMLAECECMMDDGRLSFVMLDGQRVSMSAEAMEHFKFKKGQTINYIIMTAVLVFNIAHCETQIALNKAREPFRSRT